MDRIVWLYLAQVLALAVLGVLLAAIRRQNHRQCSWCETPMSLRRVSIIQSLTLQGIWICPHCGVPRIFTCRTT